MRSRRLKSPLTPLLQRGGQDPALPTRRARTKPLAPEMPTMIGGWFVGGGWSMLRLTVCALDA